MLILAHLYGVDVYFICVSLSSLCKMLNLGHMLAKLLTSWHLMALKARFCNVFLFLLMRHCLFIFWMFIPRQAYLRCCKKQQNSRAPGSGLRFLFLCLSGYSGLSLYWLLNFFFPWGLINRKKASQLVNNLWSKLLWPVNSVIFLSTSLLLWRRQWQPTLAWQIPWMEEPGRLQSMGSLGVGHDWATSLSLFTFMHWRRKWQPTLVFLPGESQGQRSLVGCCLRGHTESDMTEMT